MTFPRPSTCNGGRLFLVSYSCILPNWTYFSKVASLDLIGVNLINFTAYECDFHAVGRLHRIAPNHDGVLITAVKKSAFSRLYLIRHSPLPTNLPSNVLFTFFQLKLQPKKLKWPLFPFRWEVQHNIEWLSLSFDHFRFTVGIVDVVIIVVVSQKNYGQVHLGFCRQLLAAVVHGIAFTPELFESISNESF